VTQDPHGSIDAPESSKDNSVALLERPKTKAVLRAIDAEECRLIGTDAVKYQSHDSQSRNHVNRYTQRRSGAFFQDRIKFELGVELL
jgi:hypothetical protein